MLTRDQPRPPNDNTNLVEAESMLRIAARKLEWLAVTEPDLSREAKIVFLAAQRVRSRRLAAAA